MNRNLVRAWGHGRTMRADEKLLLACSHRAPAAPCGTHTTPNSNLHSTLCCTPRAATYGADALMASMHAWPEVQRAQMLP